MTARPLLINADEESRKLLAQAASVSKAVTRGLERQQAELKARLQQRAHGSGTGDDAVHANVPPSLSSTLSSTLLRLSLVPAPAASHKKAIVADFRRLSSSRLESETLEKKANAKRVQERLQTK